MKIEGMQCHALFLLIKHPQKPLKIPCRFQDIAENTIQLVFWHITKKSDCINPPNA
jgi:hypothetical protein